MSSQTTGAAPSRTHETSGEGRRGLLGRLFAPVDIASLVFFRVAFGAIMLWEVCRYFYYGWVERYFVQSEFRFTYYGFDWLRLWSGEWMQLHFLALGLLAIFIALGFLYRLSTTLFFLGFTYVFLFDQSLYLNHFYLICLISLLMIFIPAHRAFSVDARLRPGTRSETAPAWALWLLVAQIGIVYFYGGLAKLNGDWLRGEPMRMWLANETDFPLIGRFFTEEWMVYFFSYGGLLLDLLVVPFLLWRRTRLFAFAAVVAFHLMNANLFQIGIFPWFAIAATLLFFPPSWPQVVGRLRVGEIFDPQAWSRIKERLRRAEAGLRRRTRGSDPAATNRLRPAQYAIVGLLGLYLAAQLLIPLRHHLYPGNVSWTEEGHRFSWHMKLRDKGAQATLFAVDPQTGDRQRIVPQEYGLSLEQAGDMAGKPDMILQFSHHVAEELREQGREDVEIRARVRASLNGREPQRFIDPRADLSEQPHALAPAGWIRPLKRPLNAQGER